MTNFSEVRCDFFDEVNGVWYVDGWFTANDNEEGIVVAKIYVKDFVVVYTDDEYRWDEYVQEVIDDKIMEIVG